MIDGDSRATLTTRTSFCMLLGNYASIPRYYASGIYRELHNKDIFLWAQAIAFKVLVTFIPLIVLGTGLVAQTIQPEQPSALIGLIIQTFFPEYQRGELVQFLEQLQQASGTITLIGIVSLTVTAKTLLRRFGLCSQTSFAKSGTITERHSAHTSSIYEWPFRWGHFSFFLSL